MARVEKESQTLPHTQAGAIPGLSGCSVSQPRFSMRKSPVSKARMSLARLDRAIPGLFVLALPGIPGFGAADVALSLLIVLSLV